jgi:c-di-GMP-binding flagellar brake protein YcgR
MAPGKIKSPEKTSNFWQPLEDGREMTTSRQIITNSLSWLKSKRILLTLLHGGYQSGGTIVIGYDHQQLEIDLPADWPNTSPQVRVLFKDRGKIWNYFTAPVKGVTSDSLLLQIPQTIYRLQRRAHFRVEAPRGSEASFIHKGTTHVKLSIQDISAGGMQVCSKTSLPLLPEDKLTAISLFFPGGNILLKRDDDPDLVLQIRHGGLARATGQESTFCYGIRFVCSQNEEKLLLNYVRQLELALLRKGLMNES